jgi:hypothetical protein
MLSGRAKARPKRYRLLTGSTSSKIWVRSLSASCGAMRRHAAVVERLSVTTALAPSVATAPPRAEREQTRHQVQDRLRRRYEAIHALAAHGLSGLAMARTLGIHRHPSPYRRAQSALADLS